MFRKRSKKLWPLRMYALMPDSCSHQRRASLCR